MKTFIIAFFCFSALNCSAQPMRDLTVGNKFVYGWLRSFQIGDTSRRFYEQVLRDTLIQGKTYGVVFNS